MIRKKPYVQFSKKVVVAVCVAVTAISLTGIAMCFFAGQMQYVADIIKTYISYAVIVFAAYSGNSAVEKWLTKRYSFGTGNPTSTEHDDTESNG